MNNSAQKQILLLTNEPYWYTALLKYTETLFGDNVSGSMVHDVTGLVGKLTSGQKPDLLLLTECFNNNAPDILDTTKDYGLGKNYILWQALAANPKYQELLPPAIVYHTMGQGDLLKEFTVNSRDSMYVATQNKKLMFYDMVLGDTNTLIELVKQGLKL